MTRPDLGSLLPSIRTPLPGARSAALVERLASTESPALTARRARRAETSGASWDPIVWSAARGANVVDADDNVFVDLASGFGVAAIGHAHPRVVRAIEEQTRTLIHGFGDVHPSTTKVALLERLAALAPFPDARVMLGAHGADAIEAALKTAMLDTRRAGVLAFEGGYHGLSHGPLAISGYRADFRAPFAAQLNPHVTFAPWPREIDSVDDAIAAVERAWDASPTPIGALFVEPIQGRGGVRIAPSGFLRALGELARARGARVIADEILVGLSRCGARYVSVEEGLAPDLVCIGKALGGGMPLSACLGRADVMASWGDPSGEAIHTATFFGHPLACAAALAALDVIEGEDLASVSRARGARWLDALRVLASKHACVREVRGRGMLIGMELDTGARTLRVVPALLARGWITLPAGARAEVLQILPPITIDDALLDAFVAALDASLAEVA
ncbi:aspartate aminotransferase family protein [Sandaracinus amylolyticus]|uniref:Gamma-aminobutyrate alpha-ketoglutarate aminotransferase n=1 Tax=Sandaracinus amylolyticus TaxID=927083 RepID=A0A0F6VZ67_9BACT|nr:aminotransferase class III-fold pyridoxal phosphate-dependent enzyme [Sandaracinus amylolyticus]AKF03375.1 Gamma-aminobutyrate alpha-ketoglutarate aminotransferase [Sandaracinus amylolyticus]